MNQEHIDAPANLRRATDDLMALVPKMEPEWRERLQRIIERELRFARCAYDWEKLDAYMKEAA